MAKTFTFRDHFQQRMQTEIAEKLSTLRARTMTDLTPLIDSPEEIEIREEGLVAYLTSWARLHAVGKLGVIVESRESHLCGMVHSVAADGFYIHGDGQIERMKEEDLWEHGY